MQNSCDCGEKYCVDGSLNAATFSYSRHNKWNKIEAKSGQWSCSERDGERYAERFLPQEHFSQMLCVTARET